MVLKQKHDWSSIYFRRTYRHHKMYAFFAFYKTRLPQKCNMYFLFKLRIGLASQSKIEKIMRLHVCGFWEKYEFWTWKNTLFLPKQKIIFWWKMSLLFKSFLRFTNYLVRKQSFDHLAKLASPLTFTCLTPPKKH